VIWDSYSAEKVKELNPVNCFSTVTQLREFLFNDKN